MPVYSLDANAMAVQNTQSALKGLAPGMAYPSYKNSSNNDSHAYPNCPRLHKAAKAIDIQCHGSRISPISLEWAAARACKGTLQISAFDRMAWPAFS